MLTPGKGVGVGTGVGVSVGTGVSVTVGVRVGVGGIGVRVAFFPNENPGIEQAVLKRLNASRQAMRQKRMRLIIFGTITEEQGGVK